MTLFTIHMFVLHRNMGARNPTRLRNEKGNHYCMNCQQPVFAKTKFRTYRFALISIIGWGLGIATLTPGGILFFGLASSGGYIMYWYFIKDPVCPICRARHFEKISDQQQGSPSRNSSAGREEASSPADQEEASSPVDREEESSLPDRVGESPSKNPDDSNKTIILRVNNDENQPPESSNDQ